MTERKTKKYQPNNYVNNKAFLGILIQYKSTPTERLYNELGKVFLQIATRYITKPKFMSYSKDRQDEMISDAYTFMLTTGMKNFDPELSNNPFAYFTQICHNSFLQHINRTKLYETRVSSLNYIDKLEEAEMGGLED